MNGFDPKSIIQAAAQSLESGHYQYALQVLDQVEKDDRKGEFWKIYGQIHVKLHELNFTTTLSEANLQEALRSVEHGSKGAKGKLAVELLLLQCRCFELQADYHNAARVYNDIFLYHPNYKRLLEVRLKATQAFKRCEMAEESLAQLQELLDDPIAPYDEPDILLLLGLGYEYAGIKGSKKMCKEAYKQAYKKSREAGRVKVVKVAEYPNEVPSSLIDTFPGFQPPQAQQATPKHVPFNEWKDDPETWTTLGSKCMENGDLVFALELFTKCLWTELGQQDTKLWFQFANLSMLLRETEAAVQAIATVYNLLPFEMSIRKTLALWDPYLWGPHLAFEEQTITKVQAIVRGNWGRQTAAVRKKIVLAERARRNAAAIVIQRTVARGTAGRVKAKRRKAQLEAEWEAYQRFLLETKSAKTIQCGWRCFVARKVLHRLKLEFSASCAIQNNFRSFVARKKLARLKVEYRERQERLGATSLQKTYRGYRDRLFVKNLRLCHQSAKLIQARFRTFIARQQFKKDIAAFRGAKQMQRIFRGFVKRVWYKNLRENSSVRIQKAYRAYIARVSFQLFKSAGRKLLKCRNKPSKTRFFQHMEFLSAFGLFEEENAATMIESESKEFDTIETDKQGAQNNSKSLKKEVANFKQEPASAGSIGKDDGRPVSAPKEIENYEQKVHHQDDARYATRKSTPDLRSEGARLHSSGGKNHERSVVEVVGGLSGSILASKTKQKEGIDIILKWLEMNERQAETIWISNWRLGTRAAKRLGEVLQKNESLKELGLGKGTALGPGGSHAIAEAMRCHNFRLSRVFINDQPDLGDIGGIHFMKTLGDFFFGRYSRLEEVSFRNIGLGDRSCLELSEGLALNNRLKSLQLENNKIKDAGARALAEIFERNETLLELDLSGNRIGSDGASALGKSLKIKVQTHALEILRLDFNCIEMRGAVLLLKYMNSCKNVRPMFLTAAANPFPPSLHKRIQSLSTTLPTFAQRGAVLDANITHHQRQRMLARREHSGLESIDEPLSPLSPHFSPIGPSSPAPNELLQSRQLGLPPVKIPRRKSPYLSVPWSPKSSAKSPNI